MPSSFIFTVRYYYRFESLTETSNELKQQESESRFFVSAVSFAYYKSKKRIK